MLSISQAASFLGVSNPTLRRWDREGKLIAFRTSGNHRRYTLAQLRRFLQGTPAPKDLPTLGKSYLYARVSSYKQKQAGNLDRQVNRLIEAHHRQF